eukprot:GILI01027791.1.p1 GENE.GILI01027791.1~~GILI01027791.1.p1  ORF type:complete len:135 (+),score=30.81 GILI01027791.1:60-464(+)
MAATDEQINLLLSKILTDRFCSHEASDFDACIHNYVIQHSDGSFVDASIQRKGIRKCEPYKEVVQKCMQDDAKQQTILRAASAAPACKNERNILMQCQRSKKDCAQEAREMIMCGMVNIVQRNKGKKGIEQDKQ